MSFSKNVLTALCALCPLLGFTEAESGRVLIQWDNDLLTGSDRNYTNGARLAYIQDLATDEAAHNWLQKGLYRLSGAEGDGFLDEYRFQNDGSNQFSWGMGLTQLMFTPEDPTVTTAPTGQRPYAGWLGLECSLHVKNESSASSVTLSMGTTGKNSYADDAQAWIHENVSGSPIFQGWDSQVPGEATLNLHFDHKRKLPVERWTSNWPLEVDGYYEWGAAAGNLRTDAYLGGLLRAGFNLPSNYITPRVQIGSYGHAVFVDKEQDSDFSAYGFAGLRGSAVLHDISLDGPVFRDFDSQVDREALVGEALLGFALRWKACELSLSRTLRTREFEGQDENQEFGSVQLRFQIPW
ncbi:MAG: lipid A deacylase LpxR family protein [Opitutaceae bacterium]